MKNVIKNIVGSTWQPLLVRYLSRTRKYQYRDIHLQIPHSVFHPGFFFSTQLLLKEVQKLALKDKKMLEPGAGSGLISIYAARRGAHVTATDINPVAIEFLRKNSQANEVSISIIESDLFDQVPAQTFDLVVINPPYYKKEPHSYADYAWNCGPQGEFFQKLFCQLKEFIHVETRVLMILCDGCDMEMIQSIAQKNQFSMEVIFTRQNLLETNFIYAIKQVA